MRVKITATSILYFIAFTACTFSSCISFAIIHTAPIVLPARKIALTQFLPLHRYRLFKSNLKGEAISIPFQIDEKDHFGDYILDKGPLPNTQHSNGVFDNEDELSFMGEDVGPAIQPKSWKMKAPDAIYEIKFSNKQQGTKEGAVYLGAYYSKAPPKSSKSYVTFNLNNAEVVTSRFRYKFDKDNYIVVRGIDINKTRTKKIAIINSSTLFLKADLKYFLTLDVNHRDIKSFLEAYKVGPIRCIARVTFNYRLFRLNIDIGMYTEVSFFSNSVTLPAIVDNPMDGDRILNKGSEFYYGFAFFESPKQLKIDTNMSPYKSTFSNLLGKTKVEDQYWFNVSAKEYNIYVHMKPSLQMKQVGNTPTFFRENTTAHELKSRSLEPKPLGESQVNFAIAMDISSFREGLHEIEIELFVENKANKVALQEYKNLYKWQYSLKRLSTK